MPSTLHKVLLLATGASALAQTQTGVPPQAEPTVKLEHFVVSASPFARNQIDLAQSTTVLDERGLSRKLKPTLGDTLAFEPGLSATSFAPGASRPLIRGLGGDRLRVLENGIGTLDASATSPDHALSVDPLLVERIEIVRGPASLLYGSNAIGGAVNVLTHRLDLEPSPAATEATARFDYGGAALGFSRGAMANHTLPLTPTWNLVLHTDLFGREHGDLRIPGYALSENRRSAALEEALEEGEPTPEFEEGKLGNSWVDALGGSLGLSLVSEKAAFGFNLNTYETQYGVPGHAHAHPEGEEHEEHEEHDHEEEAETVHIDLKQRRLDLGGEFRSSLGFFQRLKLRAARADYRHLEYEGTEIGTRFDNESTEARLEGLHGSSAGAWEGALGLQYQTSDFRAVGDEAFLPPSRSTQTALFAFEERKAGELRWQFGGRLENSDTKAETIRGSKSLLLGSASAGLVWNLDPTHSLALSFNHTERAPNAQELYADGVHAGTQAYEIGDPNLGRERALGLEASLRRRRGLVTGELTVFASRFDAFIADYRSNEHAVPLEDGGFALHAGEGTGHHHEISLPVYRFRASEARFYGAELDTIWHLHEGSGHRLDWHLGADYVHGSTDEGPLPRIPPARLLGRLEWLKGAWTFDLHLCQVLRQNRVSQAESPTPSYTRLGANLGYTFDWALGSGEIVLRADNLLDEEARVHTSFLKEQVPLAARGFSCALTLKY